MRETGILSIVKRGPTYQVRYASFNPYDTDRLPYPRPDEGALVALLHDFGITLIGSRVFTASGDAHGSSAANQRFSGPPAQTVSDVSWGCSHGR